jgi:hypothetical protein
MRAATAVNRAELSVRGSWLESASPSLETRLDNESITSETDLSEGAADEAREETKASTSRSRERSVSPFE